jgi:5-oxoprolinase (ATP-hydrolysing)
VQLEELARGKLYQRGFTQDQVSASRFLNLRFHGTDVALMVAAEEMDSYEKTFLKLYRREFGFVLEERTIIVDDVRCAFLFEGCYNSSCDLLCAAL